MLEHNQPSNIKKGRFIWRDKKEQKVYIDSFVKKIESNYYFSEEVLNDVAERIAPLLGHSMDPDLADQIY